MVTWNYWWPGLTKFVFDYVDRCDKCQQYKNFPQPPAGRLMPIGTPVEPWKAISVDFIVGLPEAQGHDALLVVVDRAKKQAHMIPTTAETSALGLANYSETMCGIITAYQTQSSQTGDHSLQQSSQRNLTNYWGFKLSCQQLSTHKQTGKQNGLTRR